MLLPDGRVLLVPDTETDIFLFDPAANELSSAGVDVTSVGDTNADHYYFGGGVLLPDGRVALVPASHQKLVLFDPATGGIEGVALPAALQTVHPTPPPSY